MPEHTTYDWEDLDGETVRYNIETSMADLDDQTTAEPVHGQEIDSLYLKVRTDTGFREYRLDQESAAGYNEITTRVSEQTDAFDMYELFDVEYAEGWETDDEGDVLQRDRSLSTTLTGLDADGNRTYETTGEHDGLETRVRVAEQEDGVSVFGHMDRVLGPQETVDMIRSETGVDLGKLLRPEPGDHRDPGAVSDGPV